MIGGVKNPLKLLKTKGLVVVLPTTTCSSRIKPLLNKGFDETNHPMDGHLGHISALQSATEIRQPLENSGNFPLAKKIRDFPCMMKSSGF